MLSRPCIDCHFWVRLLLTARRYNLVGVTRRQHRHGAFPIGQKAVTVQGGYGALFAVQVQILLALRVSRYKFYRSREVIPGYKFVWEYWRSVAIQSVSKSKNCQGILELNCEQMRVSGCKNHYKIVLRAGAKQKV